MSKDPQRDPGRARLELLGLVLAVEYLLWGSALPGYGLAKFPALASIGVILWLSHRRRSAFAGVSAARAGLLSTWGLAGVGTIAASAAVLGVARWMGWWGGFAPSFDVAALASWGDLGWWTEKAAAVVMQQLLLQWFVAPLCLEIARDRKQALVMAGLVFGAVHLPNPLLSLLTALAAPVWCALHLRTRRVLPLVASHLLLAILVRGACGDAIFNMRVGASVLPLLPRTLTAADGSELIVTPRAIEGFVDGCALRGEYAVCTGWSADVDRRRPADAIAVLAGGGLHRHPLDRRPRPDVSEHFGMPELEPAGFELELPRAWFGPATAPRFFGIAGDTAAELEYLSDRKLQ